MKIIEPVGDKYYEIYKDCDCKANVRLVTEKIIQQADGQNYAYTVTHNLIKATCEGCGVEYKYKGLTL